MTFTSRLPQLAMLAMSMAGAFAMIPTPHATAFPSQTTYTETFDDGANNTQWTWDRTTFGSVQPSGGNPNGYFQSHFGAAPNLFCRHETFTGNFRERGVSSIGADLSTIEYATQAGFITVALVHFNSTPDNLLDVSIAHFVTDIPGPVNPDYGWVSFDIPIPSDSTTLPPGWVMTGAFPVWEPQVDWNTLITDVDEVIISWTSTLVPTLLFDSIRGADNIRITEGSTAGPPTYTAIVLPQLDTTNDPNMLTFTSPKAISNARAVTGELGSRLGFVWTPEEGGDLLQPHFASVADEARGTGVNTAGDVVGVYMPTGSFSLRPFILTADNTFTALPTLGPTLAGGAADINDAGMIVGSSENAPGGGTFGGPTSAVYWVNGQIFEIGNLGGSTGGASAVNNHGVVVGASNTAQALALQPFRWTEKTGIEVLPQLVPGVPAAPADINDAGVIVGSAGLSLFENAPVYWDTNGDIHQLPQLDPEAIDVGVLAINNDGIMVGHELSSITWMPEARLWFNEKVYHLQDLVADLDPKIELRQAVDINDNGDIVVEASTEVDGAIQFITVILTPKGDEPAVPGDIDGDGHVNVTDLLAVINAWGACPKGAACPADVSNDGTVGVEDLLIVINNWG